MACISMHGAAQRGAAPARPQPAALEQVYLLRGRTLASGDGVTVVLRYEARSLPRDPATYACTRAYAPYTPYMPACLQLGPGRAARQLRGGVRHGAGGGGVQEAAAAVLPSPGGRGGGSTESMHVWFNGVHRQVWVSVRDSVLLLLLLLLCRLSDS